MVCFSLRVISWIDLFTRKKTCSRKQKIATLLHGLLTHRRVAIGRLLLFLLI